jgi:succinate dehydrogenase/fumarate reductase flavoprotein subunit
MAGFASQRGQPILDHTEIETAITWSLQPFARETGGNIFGIRREIEELMWSHGGLVRSGPGLHQCLDQLGYIGERAAQAPVSGSREYHPGWQEWLNVQSILTVAQLTCESALARRESRGSHYRSDFPELGGADWLHNVLVQNPPGGEPKLWFNEVRFPRMDPPRAAG